MWRSKILSRKFQVPSGGIQHATDAPLDTVPTSDNAEDCQPRQQGDTYGQDVGQHAGKVACLWPIVGLFAQM